MTRIPQLSSMKSAFILKEMYNAISKRGIIIFIIYVNIPYHIFHSPQNGLFATMHVTSDHSDLRQLIGHLLLLLFMLRSTTCIRSALSLNQEHYIWRERGRCMEMSPGDNMVATQRGLLSLVHCLEWISDAFLALGCNSHANTSVSWKDLCGFVLA